MIYSMYLYIYSMYIYKDIETHISEYIHTAYSNVQYLSKVVLYDNVYMKR